MAQELKGKIVSNKMAKTVVVEVSRLKKHRLYGKFMKISKKYKAHADEQIPEGTTVIIKSTRPVSKNKKWKVIKIL
ncbi:MAG: Ribosomal protein S17 [Candidatus Giovannonibacteria bacterium GW2011_GWC2_44_9]|uniref:Small ribosomal subunit protein uS17 n=3 Tax=Candidatus Giovannoniibacteriota TaxID=1752738 RepID=A0A0G1LWA2_9BACT|nr:MAG: Ribosomal protein S17 [Candidatus Giovannonibacteria bacterium GW2011_GWB1_44_23]KKT64029.1 MAG: Ribosomal protein S17 [Candidatus Giovannonibacteria bacterium GW2011_GWA1_44_29]KKT83896.1 MAG: Ribosomal protein S17 [Candidatus Giovannonibacteria bacterium GW2011_GWC2_44_9]KKT91877.1 MAG: Ribosomal protein S17 [Parcubacteria group bacterium GW2011_GWC1_45_13]